MSVRVSYLEENRFTFSLTCCCSWGVLLGSWRSMAWFWQCYSSPPSRWHNNLITYTGPANILPGHPAHPSYTMATLDSVKLTYMWNTFCSLLPDISHTQRYVVKALSLFGTSPSKTYSRCRSPSVATDIMWEGDKTASKEKGSLSTFREVTDLTQAGKWWFLLLFIMQLWHSLGAPTFTFWPTPSRL